MSLFVSVYSHVPYKCYCERPFFKNLITLQQLEDVASKAIHMSVEFS